MGKTKGQGKRGERGGKWVLLQVRYAVESGNREVGG